MANARLSLLDSIKNREPIDFAELKAGDFKQQDEAGMTPLMHAIRKSDRIALAQLLEVKNDKLVRDPGIEIEDEKGMTALMHAASCIEADDLELKGAAGRRDDINQPLIQAVLLQKQTPTEMLAQFDQVIPVIVEQDNVNFFKCLIGELEKYFPFKDNESSSQFAKFWNRQFGNNQLSEALLTFLNQFLQASNVKNRGTILQYILQQPWAVSLKKHESNKNLVLDAVQMRSTNTVCLLLENDFPVPDVKPSVLTQILQQNFYGWNAKGVLWDHDQSAKQHIIKIFATKHPKLITKEDLKAALYDRNILKLVLESFSQNFHISDLFRAWNHDYKAVIDFLINAELTNHNFIFNSNDWNVNDILGNLFYFYNDYRNYVLELIRIILIDGALIQASLVWYALSCEDERLLKTIEELITVNHCIFADKKINYEKNFNSHFNEKIWKYPKIIYCMIKAGHEKIMNNENRDAWQLLFKSYQENIKQKKPNAQAEVLALVQAAVEAKPSQLTISEDAFKQAIVTGDEKLVALLIQNGAKVKTEYSLISDSSLEQAAKFGHFKVVKTLLSCNTIRFPSTVIELAAKKFNDRSMHSYLMAVYHAALAAETGKFDSLGFSAKSGSVTPKDQYFELLHLLVTRYGCKKENFLDTRYRYNNERKETLSKEYDEYLQRLTNQDNSHEVKSAPMEQKAQNKLEQKAPENNDPLPALRIELMRASQDKDEKNQSAYQQLISAVLNCKKTPEEKLAEFDQALTVIVQYKNVVFFKSLMEELEKILPIHKNQLPNPLMDLVNRILRIAIVEDRVDVIKYIFKQPWFLSVKNHESNKTLVLDAIKARSGNVTIQIIENDFSIPESKPSILSHILQQDFLIWQTADGKHVLLGDRDQYAKKHLIRAFASKHPVLLNKEDLKTTALRDKNLLKYLIEKFPKAFRFRDLIEAWDYDYNSMVDFWIQKKLNIYLFDTQNQLCTLGSELFNTREKDRENILAGFEKILNAGIILSPWTFQRALQCEDTRLIQLIEKTMTARHFSAADKHHYSKYFFDPDGYVLNNLRYCIYNQNIWKYPKILNCLIKAGNEKIMCYRYGLSSRDAWSLVFNKSNHPQDLCELVKAAVEAKPSQLTISDEAFERSLALGDEKLVALLIQHGAKIKTDSSLLSASTLEKAAKSGHFDLVKMLLMLPQIKWSVKSLESAYEASQGDTKKYLFIVVAYEKNMTVPDKFPGDVAAQCELLHLLIMKHGFNKALVRQYEYRFQGLAEEYEKRYSKPLPIPDKKEYLPVPNAPAFLEEAKPAVVQKDGDLDEGGLNPEARIEVALPNPIVQASTPPSAPPLEGLKIEEQKVEIQPLQGIERKEPQMVEVKNDKLGLKDVIEPQVGESPRPEIVAARVQENPGHGIVAAQVEGNPKPELGKAQVQENSGHEIMAVQVEGSQKPELVKAQVQENPGHEIVAAQVEGSPKPKLVKVQVQENPAHEILVANESKDKIEEDHLEGQPHALPAVPLQVMPAVSPNAPFQPNHLMLFSQSVAQHQSVFPNGVPAANDQLQQATLCEPQPEGQVSPASVSEYKQIGLFDKKKMIQNEKMAETAALLALMIQGSDDRDRWQHLLLGLDQFFQTKSQGPSPRRYS